MENILSYTTVLRKYTVVYKAAHSLKEGPTFLQLLTGNRKLQLLQGMHCGPSIANLGTRGVREYEVPA